MLIANHPSPPSAPFLSYKNLAGGSFRGLKEREREEERERTPKIATLRTTLAFSGAVSWR